MKNAETWQWENRMRSGVLWIAVGCYESFMILWLAGLLLLLLAERICMEAVHEAGVIVVLAAGATAAFLAVILRSLMIVIVTKAFHLEYLQGEAEQRSVTEMLGWMFNPGAFGELVMILKRTFVLYGVFAYAYLPIRIFVLSAVVIVAVTLLRVIRGRDLWALLLLPAAYLRHFLFYLLKEKQHCTVLRSFCRFSADMERYFCLCGVAGNSMVGTEDTEVSKQSYLSRRAWDCDSRVCGNCLESVRGYDEMVLH